MALELVKLGDKILNLFLVMCPDQSLSETSITMSWLELEFEEVKGFLQAGQSTITLLRRIGDEFCAGSGCSGRESESEEALVLWFVRVLASKRLAIFDSFENVCNALEGIKNGFLLFPSVDSITAIFVQLIGGLDKSDEIGGDIPDTAFSTSNTLAVYWSMQMSLC